MLTVNDAISHCTTRVVKIFKLPFRDLGQHEKLLAFHIPTFHQIKAVNFLN